MNVLAANCSGNYTVPASLGNRVVEGNNLYLVIDSSTGNPAQSIQITELYHPVSFNAQGGTGAGMATRSIRHNKSHSPLGTPLFVPLAQ